MIERERKRWMHSAKKIPTFRHFCRVVYSNVCMFPYQQRDTTTTSVCLSMVCYVLRAIPPQAHVRARTHTYSHTLHFSETTPMFKSLPISSVVMNTFKLTHRSHPRLLHARNKNRAPVSLRKGHFPGMQLWRWSSFPNLS